MSQNWAHVHECQLPGTERASLHLLLLFSAECGECGECVECVAVLWVSWFQTLTIWTSNIALSTRCLACLSPCTAFLTAALFFTFKPLHRGDYFNLRVVPKSSVTLLLDLQTSAFSSKWPSFTEFDHTSNERLSGDGLFLSESAKT